MAAGSALHVIDVTEDGVLDQIGQFNSPGYGGDLASDGRNVYMLDYHMNVVNAFDLSMPQQPVWRQQFFSAHYLTDIVVGGGYFYLATYWESLQIAQVDDSLELIVLTSIPKEQAIEHTINSLYVNGLVFAQMNGRLAIIDVSDPLQPTVLNEVAWPPLDGPSYKPLAWENSILYTSQHDTFVVLNVLDPAEPLVVGQLDVNLEICDADSRNGLAFLIAGVCFQGSSYNTSKLEIINVSEPQEMSIVGSLELYDPMESVIVIGDYVYVANGDVLVVDVRDPSQPVFITTITTPGYASDLLTADGLLYVADQAGGLLVIQPLE